MLYDRIVNVVIGYEIRKIFILYIILLLSVTFIAIIRVQRCAIGGTAHG